MDFVITHNEGEDFGTLAIRPGREDDFTVCKDTAGVEIQVPLFAWEAEELRKALDALASTPAL